MHSAINYMLMSRQGEWNPEQWKGVAKGKISFGGN